MPLSSVRGITHTSYVQLPGREYYIENDDVTIAALTMKVLTILMCQV